MSATRIRKWAWAVGALLIIAAAVMRVSRSSESAPPDKTTPKSEPAAARPEGEPPAPAPQSPTPVPPNAEALKAVPCDLTVLREELRKATASPSYQHYMREQLRALVTPLAPESLWSLLVAEKEPKVLAVLAETWARRYARDPKAEIVERLVGHLQSEPEPALRATLVRALRYTGEPSTELLGRSVLKGQDVYAMWVKDASPEVRQAVVENVRVEAARNFGRFQGVAEKAVSLAVEATDPKLKAELLTASSLEAVRAPAVATVRELLQKAEAPEVRAAAARALATGPVSQAPGSMKALADHYATEKTPKVRAALLESIARLGLGKAVPVLQQLRGVDASMQDEVDQWLALLASHPQTWSLLEKDRRATETRAP